MKPLPSRTPVWRDMAEGDREADDLAAAYVFLMSQGFATGQTLVVDGGGVLV